VAAIVGDSVGYEVGKTFGPRLLALKILDKRRDKLDGAQDFLARRGGSAVFLGRFVSFFRAVMPALAGIAKMPYHRFLPWNAAGGLVWGTAFVLVGFFAGGTAVALASKIGTGLAVAVGVVVVVGIVVWRVRKERA
jgi:membrane-associated protein